MNAKPDELARKLVRNFNDIEKTVDVRLPLYETLTARLGVDTAAKHLGASIDIVAAGKRSCPYHFHHAQEEMFVILERHGTLRVAGEMIPIKAGDVIFIPPGREYPHQIINSSEMPIKYLSIGTQHDPEVVEYPDSGKYQAIARGSEDLPLRVIQKKDKSLDYWEGEP
ncbi:MAG: cupin domain-containing protein [Janthinobacterium lividum]